MTKPGDMKALGGEVIPENCQLEGKPTNFFSPYLLSSPGACHPNSKDEIM